jgi:hypothetical protein
MNHPETFLDYLQRPPLWRRALRVARGAVLLVLMVVVAFYVGTLIIAASVSTCTIP